VTRDDSWFPFVTTRDKKKKVAREKTKGDRTNERGNRQVLKAEANPPPGSPPKRSRGRAAPSHQGGAPPVRGSEGADVAVAGRRLARSRRGAVANPAGATSTPALASASLPVGQVLWLARARPCPGCGWRTQWRGSITSLLVSRTPNYRVRDKVGRRVQTSSRRRRAAAWLHHRRRRATSRRDGGLGAESCGEDVRLLRRARLPRTTLLP